MTVARREGRRPEPTWSPRPNGPALLRIDHVLAHEVEVRAVWTENAGRAERVAQRLRHGTIWINDYNQYLPQAEWGGYKQSGIGRELGPSGLDEYRETKHIWQNLAPGPTGWFEG